ncbi:mechanosensitive ion channel family protein [Phenylobacterium sp. J367]|nr:mechanosensitive ion channel family protein [Phenylobacterium sp. J367]MCR5879679.1 mechanosensitive ion channel family protein [Phenylobacterium sp. J367]
MFQSPATEATAATPAGPAEAVQPSLAEQLSVFGRDAWDHLMQLDPGEAGLNFLISAGIVLAALALIWVLARMFDRWLRHFAATSPAEVPEEDQRTSRAAGVTWALLRFLILGAALVLVAAVWGIDPWAWISGDAGARILRLGLIVVLVTALVEVAGFVTRRTIEGFAARSRDPRRAGQIRSLGPLVTGSIQAVLIVVGLLTFLSEVGVKVGPLLASAGVVGIAVGFGAQSIVKDFLTGVFLIAEDAVSVGDNVRIADCSGTVEAMTLRTIRLRSMNGTLHIIPYSEAQIIHNRTKLFSSYVFDLQIAYDSDIDQALAVMAEVGEGMRGGRRVRPAHPASLRDSRGRAPGRQRRRPAREGDDDPEGTMAGRPRVQPSHQAGLRPGRHRNPLPDGAVGRGQASRRGRLRRFGGPAKLNSSCQPGPKGVQAGPSTFQPIEAAWPRGATRTDGEQTCGL